MKFKFFDENIKKRKKKIFIIISVSFTDKIKNMTFPKARSFTTIKNNNQKKWICYLI